MCGGGSSGGNNSYNPKMAGWGGGGGQNQNQGGGGGLRLNEWPTMTNGVVTDPRYKGTAGRQQLDFGHYENGHWMEHNPGGSEQGDYKPPVVTPTPTPTPQLPALPPPPQFWGDLEQQWAQFSRNPADWAPGTDMNQAKLNFMNAGGMNAGATGAPNEMGDPGALLQAPYSPYAAPLPLGPPTGQFAGSSPWQQYGFGNLQDMLTGFQTNYG